MESGSSKKRSIKASSCTAAASTNFSLHSWASAIIFSGISFTVASIAPFSHTYAFISTKSTIPWKFSSAPIGNTKGTGLAPNFSLISRTALKKSAPERSILFTKAIRGTPYLFAWRHTVSDCASTPPTAQNKATAPSNTRRERSTSTVKSTCPGVSIILIL